MPARKRSVAEVATEPINRRRSVRTTTSKRSSYFEAPSDEESDLPPKKRGHHSLAKTQSSEDQYENEPEEEAFPEVTDEDDENDDDAPRKVIILPLERLRDTGGVEYDEKKLHKNTMLFLKDLKENNERKWLKSHDGEYRRSLKDWESFVERVMLGITEVDETIPELPVKDVIFRIHRDVRFSKNPTPYKPHFSAAFSRTGRKGPYACYYIHCEPKACFIGGGIWHPEREPLAKLRESIDRHPARWRRVLNTPEFKKIFFPNIKANTGDEKVVDSFLEKNKENALKKRPQGYDPGHRDIKLLRLRNFTVGKKIDDSFLCEDDAQEKIAEVIRGMEPFVTFLNSVVMPDPGQGDNSSDEEEADEANEDGDDSSE